MAQVHCTLAGLKAKYFALAGEYSGAGSEGIMVNPKSSFIPRVAQSCLKNMQINVCFHP